MKDNCNLKCDLPTCARAEFFEDSPLFVYEGVLLEPKLRDWAKEKVLRRRAGQKTCLALQLIFGPWTDPVDVQVERAVLYFKRQGAF